jgi:hypothetical protein
MMIRDDLTLPDLRLREKFVSEGELLTVGQRLAAFSL